MIIEVFVTQRQRADTLAQQLRHAVLDQRLKSVITKTVRQAFQRPPLQIHASQQQRAAITAQMPSAKISRHFAVTVGLKLKTLLITLCHSEVPFGCGFEYLQP
jgi:hypothetical protein